MSPSPVEELALTDLDRSNKGASKQRRDLINAEIGVMRDLLPLPESARQRLSQLQIMSLSCVYIRKCNVLHKLFSSLPAETDLPTTCDFSQALTGFLLITTREGKLVYISENVTDYLGHSMVDMKTQGDSLYDIVDKRDHSSVQAHLLQGRAEPDLTQDVTFFCRMNMSRTLKRQAGFGDVKVMHVRGHFLPISDLSSDKQSQQQQQQQQQQKYVFMATCSPLITPELKETLIQSNTMVFKTVHKLDMTFLEVTKTAEFHLGCTVEEICEKSWYSMLHPEDIHEAQEKHVLLMRANHELSCMMTVRMLTAAGDPVWVNVVMHVNQPTSSQADDSLIVCINQVISEEEAYQIRMQSHMFTLYPPRTAELWNTATLSHPQPAQPDTAFWMTATSPMVSSVPGFSYPSTSRPILSQQQHALPAGDRTSGQDGKGYLVNPPSSSPSTTSTPILSSSAQTDKLKLMLKRKLQGPCHQAKIPKMGWDETPSTMGGTRSRQDMENTAITDSMNTSQGASQFMISGKPPRGYSWPASTQVVPHAQYQVAHVFPVTMTHQNNVMTSMLSPPRNLESLSPPLCQPTTNCQGTEQVVPGGDMAVPESFLTPDPSPASSPNPQTSGSFARTEDKTVPTSAAILKELEKLADLTQAKSTSAISSTGCQIKMEKSLEDCRQASRQKELPIMDAFDIESFFHNLDFNQQFITLNSGSKQQHQITPEDSVAKLEKAFVSKPAPIPQIVKQEHSDMHYCPLRATCVNQQQVHSQTRKTEPPQQPEMDPREFEELLSYFSGDMTATQLNLDSLLSSPLPKKEIGEVDTLQQQRDSQDSELCGAGHPGSFLLCNATLERAQEGFSPSSNSDTSGDEDHSREEILARLLKPDSSVTGQEHGGQLKRDGEENHNCAPSFGPSPTYDQQATQDVPGIHEEDELYQLNKLLSLMASDNGIMLSEESQ